MTFAKREGGVPLKDISPEMIGKILKPRKLDIHKGDCGRTLIVAGSSGMTGAAVFSCRSALRSGAGLVYSCTSPENFDIIRTMTPESICVTWNEAAKEIGASSDGNGKIGSDFRRRSYDAVAFGPGMGTGREAAEMLAIILENYAGPLVLDADGLNLISLDESLRKLMAAYKGEIVITPHAGEAQRLINCLPDGKGLKASDRENAVIFLAEEYGVTAVLKGAGTLVFSCEHREHILRNTTGNPGMATAGAGDVLTGVITSLAGQGYDLYDAAALGVYIHGRAGDIGASDKGEFGLIASDIIEAVPYAIKEFI